MLPAEFGISTDRARIDVAAVYVLLRTRDAHALYSQFG